MKVKLFGLITALTITAMSLVAPAPAHACSTTDLVLCYAACEAWYGETSGCGGTFWCDYYERGCKRDCSNNCPYPI